jgi:TolA-binding protein
MARHCLIILALLLVSPAGRLAAQNTKETADFKLAINLYNDGLYDLAAEQLKQFIGSYPNTDQGIEARFYLGLTEMKLKKFDEARLTFQTFALSNPSSPRAPEAWWKVGETFVATNNYREAALAFERLKAFHPKSKQAPDALLKSAEYFSLAGERDNARRVLRIILQEYGSSTAALSARTSLARIYFEEGNPEQARNELRRVIDGDPSPEARAQALLVLGNIHQSTGNTEEARAAYQEITTKYRTSSALPGAYVSLGQLLAASGEHSAAVENLKKALAEKSLSDTSLIHEALLALGDEQTALKDYPGAVSSYERALALRPAGEQASQVLWKCARASALGKNYRKSNEACARILKSPGSESLRRRAHLRQALNAQEQKNFEQSVQLFLSYAEQNPDDPAAAKALFRAATITQQDLRDPRKASVLFDVLAFRPQRTPLADDALAGSALCNEQAKEFARAVKLYREIPERYPGSDRIAEAEKRALMIQTFEAKDKDSGLEKLALLVGDVVAQKDRAGLAFRLGEIYFRDLKNYEGAAGQFRAALEGGISGPRAADCRYYNAESLRNLSLREPAHRSEAIAAYEEFLSSSPDDTRAEDAALALFELRASGIEAARAASAEILERYPSFRRRDALLLRSGILLEESDSLSAAAAIYDDLLSTFPLSPSDEEGGYRYFRILQRLGLPDSAARRAEVALAQHPHGRYSPLFLSQIAGSAINRGNAQKAIDCYQRLIDEFFYTPQAEQAPKLLADAMALNGNYAEAVSQYREILARSEDNPMEDQELDPGLLLALGKASYLGGNYAEARGPLLRLLALESTGPRAGEAYTTLGVMARSDGSLQAATAYFRQATAAAPGATATPDVADLLYESGEYGDARTLYTQLARVARTDEERHRYEARAILSSLKNDDLSDAETRIASFQKKYEVSPDDLASFELERGNYHFRKKDYPRALKSYAAVIHTYDSSPSVPDAIYWTGKTLEAQNKPKEAIEQLTQITADYPGAPVAPRAWVALGNLYYGLEQWDNAVKSYRQVVDNPKTDPALMQFAMSNLIETYQTAGAFDGALALTRKYLELYPNSDDNLDKRIKIGILYDRLGYYDQAVLHLQGLLDEAGSDLEGEIRYYIAEANYNKGDYQQAILDFLKVPYLVTKKGKIDWTANSLYMSGQAYEKMGRYDQALAMYQQILDRPGIDGMFRAAAQKEIDRVKLVLKKKTR